MERDQIFFLYFASLCKVTFREEKLVRRSTIHVDDRIFCDKAVLQSIYGHTPSHVSRDIVTSVSSQRFNSDYETRLRTFIHQKSVPNLYQCDDTPADAEVDGENLKRKRSFKENKLNLPIQKEYIRAYTKFYERRIAMRIIDLNKFIRQERDISRELQRKLDKSFKENDKLLLSLQKLKKDIHKFIKDIETPV